MNNCREFKTTNTSKIYEFLYFENKLGNIEKTEELIKNFNLEMKLEYKRRSNILDKLISNITKYENYYMFTNIEKNKRYVLKINFIKDNQDEEQYSNQMIYNEIHSRYEFVDMGKSLKDYAPSQKCIYCPSRAICKFKPLINLPIEKEEIEKSNNKKFEFNYQQQAFIDSDKDLIMTSAGAGSGKTTTLAAKCATEKGLKGPLSKTLFLSFGKQSVIEMDKKINLNRLGDDRATILTLDSLAAKAVHKYPELLGYQPGYAIIDNLEELSVMNDYNVYNKDLARNGLKNYAYISNFYTFDKSSYVLEKIIEFNLFEDLLGFMPDVIILDEFQDTSINEIRLLITLLNKKMIKQLILLGDQNQTIFEFRGAVSNAFKLIEENLDPSLSMDILSFTISHRVTKDIAKISNEIIKEKSYVKNSKIIDGFNILESEKDEGEIKYISDINKHIGSLLFKKENNIALLTRTNAEAYFLYKYLNTNTFDNSATIYADYPFFELLENIMWQEYKNLITKNETNEVLNYAYLVLNQLQQKNQPQINQIDFLIKNANDNVARKIKEKLMEFKIGDLSDLYSLILQLKKETLLFIPTIDQVVVSTIHRSKGMEFDNVVIFGYNHYKIPNLISANIPEKEKELAQIDKLVEMDKKVLFTGVTRSKKNLYLHVNKPTALLMNEYIENQKNNT